MSDPISMASMAHADPRILSQKPVKSTDSPAKIQDAAQQFEGLLLAQLLSSAHGEGGWLGSGSDGASGTATGFAEQQLAAVMAQNGGLGLSKLIATGLERRNDAAHADPSNAPSPGATPPSHP
jgi:Rod binding domain-containing protein